MHRTRIKICGVTRAADALAASAAGADAIGMVFHPPAPRHVSLDAARQILRILPPFITSVGLFVDQSPLAILNLARELALGAVQLHGNESPDDVAALAPLPVIKAIRVTAATLPDELTRWRAAVGSLPHLRGLVLDSAHPTQSGGSGLENDWAAIASAQERGLFTNLPPLIAAGGLTPVNVAAVIRTLHPHAVDVSSGVEAIKGQKSPDKLAAFVKAVCEADAEIAERDS
jgi:phosphoribosylanthranilate isomerase